MISENKNTRYFVMLDVKVGCNNMVLGDTSKKVYILGDIG